MIQALITLSSSLQAGDPGVHRRAAPLRDSSRGSTAEPARRRSARLIVNSRVPRHVEGLINDGLRMGSDVVSSSRGHSLNHSVSRR